MSTKVDSTRVSTVVLESIIEFIEDHDDPAVTVSEVADGVDGIDHEQAKYRLQKLADSGQIHKKKIGASAAIWYVRG